MNSGSGPLFVGPDMAAGETVAVVAQPPQPPDEPGGQQPDFGKSSPVGLLVLLLFFIAVAFLVRSMTKHLKRVPASFDKPGDDAEPVESSAPADPPAPSDEKPAEDKK